MSSNNKQAPIKKLIDSKAKLDNLLYQLSKWYKKLGGKKLNH